MIDTRTLNRTEVRSLLDAVKAEGRTALTAPEGKLVCEAYGITVPKEGVATSAADAAAIATASTVHFTVLFMASSLSCSWLVGLPPHGPDGSDNVSTLPVSLAEPAI